MRKTEAHKRNLRHTKKRAAGLRRYGKREQRAFRDYKRADRAALRREFAIIGGSLTGYQPPQAGAAEWPQQQFSTYSSEKP